jgi:hypothetical protein
LGNQIVFGGIDSDPVKPGIKSRIAPKLRKCTIGFDKCFLDNILGFCLIAHKSRHKTHQLPLILGYQKLERLFVATLDAINQKLINVAFCCQCLIPLADASDATLWS